MSLYENLKTFDDKPVVDFKKSGDVTDFTNTAVRLRCAYDDDETLEEYVLMLLNEPGVEALETLVFGIWMEGGEAYEVSPMPAIELLVAEKAKLPALKAMFVGDIISEENEMSWIEQGDVSSLWAAFPKLELFTARGGNNLRLGKINHSALKQLVIQTGGMPANLAKEAMEANAPITHLELWLGDENYGASASVYDFAALFDGELFPGLDFLGFRNAADADDIAAGVATSTILSRISTLDMSLGALSDKGAQALLDGGQLGHLKVLDVSHNYLSEDMVAALAAVAPGLSADDQKVPEDYGDGEVYYQIAVSE